MQVVQQLTRLAECALDRVTVRYQLQLRVPLFLREKARFGVVPNVHVLT